MWVHNTVKFDVLFYRCQLNISHSNFCTFLFLFFTPSNICRMVALKDFAWMYLHLQNGRANIFHSTCKLVFAFICCVNKNCSVPLTELTKPCVLILSSPLKSARSLLVFFCFFLLLLLYSRFTIEPLFCFKSIGIHVWLHNESVCYIIIKSSICSVPINKLSAYPLLKFSQTRSNMKEFYLWGK